MNKPIISSNFTIDDIHKIREYNYELTKTMTEKEKNAYYEEKANRVRNKLKILNEKKVQTS